MVTFVPTPIGNVEDISHRALKALQEASVIFCEDSRVTKKLLLLLSQKFNLSFKTQKFIPLHSHNEQDILSTIDKSIFDEEVVYVSDAGMPGISDPGFWLVKFCQENSIKYDILAGANAALIALVGSAFSEKEFFFIGFLPHKGKERKEKLNDILALEYASVVYESPHRIEKLIQEISIIEPNRKIYAIKEATKLHQKSFLDTAENLTHKLKETNIKGEWCVVISPNQKKEISLTLEEIDNLDLSKKEKAKILSKITKKSVKECYNELVK